MIASACVGSADGWSSGPTADLPTARRPPSPRI
jgi:hypothetical protein